MFGVRRRLLAVAVVLMLAGCGGSGGGSGGDAPTAPATPPPVAAPKPTAPEASRLLTQATFGPTDASIAAVREAGYAAWVDQQLAAPVSNSHLAHLDARLPQLRERNPNAQLAASQFYESFWLQAATGPDQLRQRVKFALSQIFVISLADPAIDVRGAASYYDMLGANAFGNYRTLLEQVSLHPMMGVYLSHLANQREDPRTGRSPDENYARELMQLMTLGVYKLRPDGAIELDAAGSAIPSYSSADVSGLAKVFTGFSWWSPSPTNNTFFGRNRDPAAVVTPMIAYASYHSASEKAFLGAIIPANVAPDAGAELKIALDVAFAHPNVGPFVSRQLIQRLVTSNPSSAYVGRVAAVFDNNGSGVRGDLGAVVRAILLDAEARDAAAAAAPTFGKLREPVVRMANWMRAFDAGSQSGAWLLVSTSSNTSLSQSPLAAPSVFNFFRPGHAPPNTRVGALGLVAPEFQLVEEVSVAGYLNTMQTAIDRGVGNTPPGGSGADVRAGYAAEMALANNPAALIDRVDLLLLYGAMSPTLRARIVEAVSAVPLPAANAPQANLDAALLNRSKLAVFLAMASPEYLAQR